MAEYTVFHPGGFDPAKPANNRAERWDTAGYTRWDKAGAVVEQRNLTPDESASLAAQDAAQTVGTNETTLRDRLRAAVAVNTTFIGAAKPGTAATQASAAYDQAVRLSRQVNALIKTELRDLATTDGT